MVKGQLIQRKDPVQKPNVIYRQIDALNASMVRMFDTDPVKFYEIFKLGKKKKDLKSTAIIIGDLVDFYLLDCKGDESQFDQRFDERFALYENSKGSGQVFVLADKLFEITQEHVDETGEVVVDFSTRFTEALQRVQTAKDPKYKGRSEEYALKDFYDNGYAYFQTMLNNLGKTVVEVSILDKAKLVAQILLNDEFTQDVFAEDDEETETFYKFPIEWEYKTRKGNYIKCKSELDILRISHFEKKIYLKDLKTTYDNEQFESSYIRNGYYIQSAFYYLAVEWWALQNNLEDYQIVPMEFIVGDTSANNRRPIRYETDIADVQFALNGFMLAGVEHKGIHALMEEISWAEESGVWNCSKTVMDNGGKVKLGLQYE